MNHKVLILVLCQHPYEMFSYDPSVLLPDSKHFSEKVHVFDFFIIHLLSISFSILYLKRIDFTVSEKWS